MHRWRITIRATGKVFYVTPYNGRWYWRTAEFDALLNDHDWLSVDSPAPTHRMMMLDFGNTPNNLMPIRPHYKYNA